MRPVALVLRARPRTARRGVRAVAGVDRPGERPRRGRLAGDHRRAAHAAGKRRAAVMGVDRHGGARNRDTGRSHRARTSALERGEDRRLGGAQHRGRRRSRRSRAGRRAARRATTPATTARVRRPCRTRVRRPRRRRGRPRRDRVRTRDRALPRAGRGSAPDAPGGAARTHPPGVRGQGPARLRGHVGLPGALGACLRDARGGLPRHPPRAEAAGGRPLCHRALRAAGRSHQHELKLRRTSLRS